MHATLAYTAMDGRRGREEVEGRGIEVGRERKGVVGRLDDGGERGVANAPNHAFPLQHGPGAGGRGRAAMAPHLRQPTGWARAHSCHVSGLESY